jgi:alpha-beta hydrolase superfamily lysophospholipase
VKKLLVVLLMVYVAVCALVYLIQTDLMFSPLAQLPPRPADFTDLPLTAPDGTHLFGWQATPHGRKPSRWVLLCHGNGGNMGAKIDTVELLIGFGLGVVIFDYRGYGQSGGQLTREADILMDGQTYYNELRQQTHHIILYGESMGGGVAANLADRNPCDALILQSTFTSLSERAWESYPFLPVRWLNRYPLDVIGPVIRLKVPLLVMHSPEDKVISFKMGQRIFAAAHEPKQWAALKGPHAALDLPEVEPALRRFMATL